ncbi:hypothetical protein [Streptomyces sp. NPDC058953]|uniref:hypothetical protein n=1 Tax=unclassified Streptomyces TaxID=2593676 RepID=UPI0036A787C6
MVLVSSVPPATRWARGPVAVAALSALLLLTGCTDGGDDRPAAARSSAAAPAAGKDAISREVSLPPKARTAEEVHGAVLNKIAEGEGRYGSGTGSPCSTASARMFTEKCAAAAAATDEAAALALRETAGREGFATLTGVARKLRDAVGTYGRLECAKAPAAESARTACRAPAALIAQGYEDLRGGANAALTGG